MSVAQLLASCSLQSIPYSQGIEKIVLPNVHHRVILFPNKEMKSPTLMLNIQAHGHIWLWDPSEKRPSLLCPYMRILFPDIVAADCFLFFCQFPSSMFQIEGNVSMEKSWSGIQGQHRLIKMVELLAFINSSATVNLSPGQDKRGSFTLLICSGLCHELPSLPHHFCSIPKENSPVFLGSSHSNLPLAPAFWKSNRGKESP